ncbi:UNVERIFIED_CONTAM: Opsin-5 [Trichonephila clavipes]
MMDAVKEFWNYSSIEETIPDGKEAEERINYEIKISRNFDSPLPLTNPYITAYLIVVVATAVASNSLVLLVMSFRKKKLRTFQMCLISMCISDLLFSICLHPMSIATALGYDAKRIFNHSGCLYFGIMALFFGTYDMVAHSLIAVLRYINLCHPSGGNIFFPNVSNIYLKNKFFENIAKCLLVSL